MPGLVVREFNGKVIEQRSDDGYMDATAMCRANGKKWSHYWANKNTQEFIEALSADAGIPASGLVEVRKGGTVGDQGTYVHPRVATHLAQWCSPKFAVLVSGWVLDILTTGKAEVAPSPQPAGDPILAQIEYARTLRLAQIEHERRLATVQATADRALREATAAHQTRECNYGWYSVLAYAKRTGRTLSVTESAKVGKALADKLRAIGGQPQRVADPRFGFVNLYPESLLAEHFDDADSPVILPMNA
jgi:hypothetical protein